MQVLVDPLAPPVPEYFSQVDRLLASGQGFTETIVFDGPKSGLAAPACCLFDREGHLLATRFHESDAATAAMLVQGLIHLEERPRPYARAGISYLPVLPRCRLVVVGGGHVGQAIGKLAPDLDFDVAVVDDRAEYVTRERFPLARQLLHGPIDEVLRNLSIDADTYCVIVTRGHNHDEEALYHLANRGAAYVGMIGSRRKIKLIFDDLEAEGISREALARVHAPIGLEIGSQTVPEIAVSILAELVAYRNLGDRFSRDGQLASTSESPCEGP
jgi:xanthine dehydrogenase accessory factor